ncbi:MAG: hypothetical protein AAF725_00215 [Acidobacteriota bacterium]
MAKIKGIGILNVVKLLRERRDHAEPLLDPEMRPYLDQQILVASWYPEKDFFRLLRTMALLTPKSGGDPWQWLGAHCAEVDLIHIYSSMVQKGNIWGTLERLPRLWRLYHDSGSADVGMMQRAQARIILTGFEFAGEDFSRFQAGYLACMLRLAGAQGVSVKPLRRGSATEPAMWLASWRS